MKRSLISIVVASAQGLEPKGFASINQHLRTVQLPAGPRAEVTRLTRKLPLMA